MSRPRRQVLAGLATTLPALAGCLSLTPGNPIPEGKIGVWLDNRHDTPHEMAIRVTDSDTDTEYYEQATTLDAGAQHRGQFDDPGPDVDFTVTASVDDDQHETVKIRGQERQGLDVVRSMVLEEGQLNVFWAANVEQ